MQETLEVTKALLARAEEEREMPLTAEIAEKPADVILEGGHVVAEDFKATAVGDVWVQEGRIRAVGDSSSWNVPEGVARRDVRGCTVAPGIVDGHVHISYLDAEFEEEQDLYLPLEYRALLSGWYAGQVLAAGVTTMVVPGTMGNIAVAVRDAIASRAIPGPRVIAAGRYLSPYSNYPSWMGNLPTENLVVVPDEESIRREIYKQFLDRVDIVKILGSGEGSTSHIPTFRERDVALIVELAQLEGKQVFMHARSAYAALAAARSGVDVVLHADYLADADLDEFAQHSPYLSPVLTMAANMAEFGHLVGITESSRKFFRERLDIASKVARQLRERGVRLVAGTESGFSITPHGEWHTREGQLFVDLIGLSPLEALEASTQAVADAVGIGRQTGSISPGKDADVLVVEGRADLDFNLLAEASRRRALFIRGREVTLKQIPERRKLSFERVRRMTVGQLTRELSRTVTTETSASASTSDELIEEKEEDLWR
jgi:imidazolonepropionase-like amidohydrolase